MIDPTPDPSPLHNVFRMLVVLLMSVVCVFLMGALLLSAINAVIVGHG